MAMTLSGYCDTQIQKMGHWQAATFIEYIREQLSCYSKGMSINMKQHFKFVNIVGLLCHPISIDLLPGCDSSNWSA